MDTWVCYLRGRDVMILDWLRGARTRFAPGGSESGPASGRADHRGRSPHDRLGRACIRPTTIPCLHVRTLGPMRAGSTRCDVSELARGLCSSDGRPPNDLDVAHNHDHAVFACIAVPIVDIR